MDQQNNNCLLEKQNNDKLLEVQKSKRARRWRVFYLEPALALYAMGDFMNYTLLQQYVYYRVAQDMGLPVDYIMEEAGRCGTLRSNSTNTSVTDKFGEVEAKVQSQAALINLALSIFIQIPSIIVSLLLGAWTDNNGRRPALLSPVVGSMTNCVIQLLVMYLELPVYYLLLAKFMDGCSGYIPTMQQTAMAYVVDITSESSRIFRVGILQCVVLMSGVFGNIMSGYGIELFGFIPPVWLTLAFQIASFIYIFLFVPESRAKVPNSPRLFSTHSFRNMWRVYSKPRSDGGRKLLSLLTLAIGFLWMSYLGIDGFITLFYLASPLCFSSVMIGYMFSYWTFIFAISAVLLTLKPFLKHVGELKMSIIGAISLASSLVLLAFCDRRWMVFIVPVVSTPGGAVDPILKGWISKIVSSDEQGAMFAVVTTTQTVFVAVGMFVFNPIYAALVEVSYGGLTFLFAAGVTVLSLIIICYLKEGIYVVEQKQAKSAEVKYCNKPWKENDGTVKFSSGVSDAEEMEHSTLVTQQTDK